MEGNNKFLESYKERIANETEQSQTNSGEDGGKTHLRFEQKSGFVKPKKKEGTGPVKTQNRRKIWTAIAGGGLALVALIVGLIIFFGRGVKVIDLSDWTENDAQLWAKDNGLVLQVEKEYSDEVEEGRIISQDLAEGEQVKKGGFIKVIVSLGHDLTVRLPLPDIMSMTKEQVEAWAAENFMAKVRITGEHSDVIPLGNVIRFEINDDTVVDEVSRNTPIYVIVSKGPEDESALDITIPNFKEMAIPEIYAFANENGLSLLIEEEYDDYVPEGIIISQSIKAEEKVKKGTEITLVVSKGKMIVIPNFSGYTKERATALASELGIPVSIKERYSSVPSQSFISQSIKAGTEYEKGEILELTYSIDNKVVIPSFVEQTREAIETWAKELNDQGASITIKVTNTKSNSPTGTILYQDKTNRVIDINTTINITVSQGKVVYVPDFVAPEGSGYDFAITRDKALAMCEELNIVPVFQEESKANRLPGEIWSQSVEAGKEISEGTTIVLKYTPANTKVTVPNFIGMRKEDILGSSHNKILDIRFEEDMEYVEGYEGKIYKQSLRANTQTAAGSVIILNIGPTVMEPNDLEYEE